jgi:hypothetical protein
MNEVQTVRRRLPRSSLGGGVSVAAVALALCASGCLSGGGQTSAEGSSNLSSGDVLARLPPPYALHLSTLAEIVYLVPSERLAAKVAPGLGATPMSVLGQSPLMVVVAHYDSAKSLATGNTSAPYDEISYATAVVRNGTPGIHFFELHLDSEEARTLGRDLYGYPKDIADVTVTDTEAEVGFDSSNAGASGATPLGSLRAHKLNGPLEIGAGIAEGLAAKLAAMTIPGVWLVKNGAPVYGPTTIDVSITRARPLRIESIALPYAVGAGLLEPAEVSSPLFAMYSTNDTMTLGAPR